MGSIGNMKKNQMEKNMNNETLNPKPQTVQGIELMMSSGVLKAVVFF